MPTYQCVGFYSKPTAIVGGATVVYYSAPDRLSAMGLFTGLIDKLRDLQSPTWQWDFARVSDVSILGDAYVVSFLGTKPGTFVPTVPPLREAGLADCLLLRKVDPVNAKHGFIFLHGHPQNEFAGRSYTPDAAAIAALLALGTYLTANPPMWAHRTNPGVTPPVYTYIGFNDVTPIKLVTHKIGRPFDDIRGRRRVA
jgi:hypothetical protein